MLVTDLYLHGLASYVPDNKITIAEAVAQQLITKAQGERDAYTAIAVEPKLFPPAMALKAARKSLQQINLRGQDLSALIHTAIHRHGHPNFWLPAAYLQRNLQLRAQAPVFSLNHGCNSFFSALTTLPAFLQGAASKYAAIVSADRFADSGFNRWSSDYGMLYGDAAVAAVFSNNHGFAKISYFDLLADPELEAVCRYDAPIAETKAWLPVNYDLKAVKKAYFHKRGRSFFLSRYQQLFSQLRERLLSVIDLQSDPVNYLIFPNVGQAVTGQLYQQLFADLGKRNCWDFGLSVGHTGPSDQFLALADLYQKQQLKTGDRVLLVGAGVGLSCALCVLEIIAEPEGR